jgi:hypothetical protein
MSKVMERALYAIPSTPNKRVIGSNSSSSVLQLKLLAPAENNSIVKIVDDGVVPIRKSELSLIDKFDMLRFTVFNYPVFAGTFTQKLLHYNLEPTIEGVPNLFISWTQNGSFYFKSLTSIGRQNVIHDVRMFGTDIYVAGVFCNSISLPPIYLYNKRDPQVANFFIGKYNVATNNWDWVRTVKPSRFASHGAQIRINELDRTIYVVVEYEEKIIFDTIPEISYTTVHKGDKGHVIIELILENGDVHNILSTGNKRILLNETGSILIFDNYEIRCLNGLSANDQSVAVKIDIQGTNVNTIYNYQEILVITDDKYINGICIDGIDRILHLFQDRNKYVIVVGKYRGRYRIMRLDKHYKVIGGSADLKLQNNGSCEIISIRGNDYSDYVHIVVHYPDEQSTHIYKYTFDERNRRTLGVIHKYDNDILEVGNMVHVEFMGVISNEYAKIFTVGNEYFVQEDGTINDEQTDYYWGTAITYNRLLYSIR